MGSILGDWTSERRCMVFSELHPTRLLNNCGLKMPYFTNWDDFSKAAERLCLNNPTKSRFVTKYDHKKGKLVLKMTDDVVCIQYRTDQLQDVKRLEKLTASLMRNIVSK